MLDMNLLALPAFNDNCMWVLDDDRNAIGVDPGDSEPVIAASAVQHRTQTDILVMRHHADHAGGLDGLRHLLNGEVFGPARESIAQPFVALVDGLAFEVIDVPGDVRVCCAHEYALANLKFARTVEPHNADLGGCTHWCEMQRADSLPTFPSPIAQERSINPFLRRGEPAVVQAARLHGAANADETEVFSALRQWKNDHR